jgi:hypothetical protein
MFEGDAAISPDVRSLAARLTPRFFSPVDLFIPGLVWSLSDALQVRLGGACGEPRTMPEW